MAKKLARKKPAAKAKALSPKPKGGQYVYLFGRKTDGNGTMKPLLGGKGANLAEMCRIGLPVPPGFTITTEVCTYYYDHKRAYPAALQAQMKAGVAAIEAAVAAGDYRRGFAEAAKFGPAVDKFFTDVFVMVDDQRLRTARLALMKRLESLILTLGDISEIVAESRT